MGLVSAVIGAVLGGPPAVTEGVSGAHRGGSLKPSNVGEAYSGLGGDGNPSGSHTATYGSN